MTTASAREVEVSKKGHMLVLWGQNESSYTFKLSFIRRLPGHFCHELKEMMYIYKEEILQDTYYL